MVYTLVRDELLPYMVGRLPTFAHVRCFEDRECDERQPIVVVGQLSDYTGPSVCNSAEEIAATLQSAYYPDGRRWRYVEYWPTPCDDRSLAWPEFRELTFVERCRRGLRWRAERAFARRRSNHRVVLTVIDEKGAGRYPFPGAVSDNLPWQFAGPHWSGPARLQVCDGEHAAVHRPDALLPAELVWPTDVLLPELLGATPIMVWPPQLYTAELIGGTDSQPMVDTIRAELKRLAGQTCAIAEAWTRATPAAIVEFGSEPDPSPRGW